jgi:hypothetical protein
LTEEFKIYANYMMGDNYENKKYRG